MLKCINLPEKEDQQVFLLKLNSFFLDTVEKFEMVFSILILLLGAAQAASVPCKTRLVSII